MANFYDSSRDASIMHHPVGLEGNIRIFASAVESDMLEAPFLHRSVHDKNRLYMIQIGDKMPDFEVMDQNGKLVSSKDLIGRKTIIYFYPKDNTSGCTEEACNLRDNYQAMIAKGYNVIGVSKDSAASHKKFADKYQLPFTLLADTSTDMIQTFGAWGEKSLYGKKYMGTLRMTFIFDEDGILTEIIEKVNTKNHAQQIMKA